MKQIKSATSSMAVIAALTPSRFSIASGEPLDEVEREAVDGLDFARKTGSSFVFAIILNKLYLIRRLRGLPLDLRLFDDREVDECEYEQYLEANSNLTNPAYAYWTRKLQACVFAEDYASALDAAVKAQGMLLGPSLVERAEYHFYAALARAGSVDTVDYVQPDRQTTHREALIGAPPATPDLGRALPREFREPRRAGRRRAGPPGRP